MAKSDVLAEKGRKAVAANFDYLSVLKVEYVPVDSVKPNSYNPNRQTEHEFELLCKSIEEDGFTQPIVVQRDSMIIVDGEHRWRAAGHMGLSEIPVVFVDMTAEQMRISTLRHNRARGSEDPGLSADVLRDLRSLGALEWAADSLMLSDREIDKIIADVGAVDGLAQKEYSESWVPGEKIETKTTPFEPRSGLDYTPDARVAVADIEARIISAPNDDERQAVQLASEVFRVNVMFSQSDAVFVRKALGEKEPALTLLKLVRLYKEHGAPNVDV